METKKRALGRGLEELFNNENIDFDNFEKNIIETTPRDEIIEINLEELRVNPYQPRKIFDEDALNELTESIKEHGVFQPIIVKKSIKGYEIIAGERRVRAAKRAGLKTIPAIIRDFTDEEMMEIALLENLQRENLTVIEEAYAYKALLENLEITQDELSKKVGKSRSHITNIVGLLRLPEDIQKLVSTGKISMGHARALSKLEDENEMHKIADKIISENINVRGIEELTGKADVKKANKIKREPKVNEYKYVEDLLRDKLDTRVKITDKKIEISYVNTADLNRILEILDIKGE
jgi:ParB family chromosome partitioning protein